MMIRRSALPGMLALAMLAACSKQAPPQPSVAEPAATPPVEQAPPPDTAVEYDRAKFVSGLLGLIDATPQCEQFRTELEAAGKDTGAPMMRSDVDRMNKIVGQAMQAGCYHKP
jgi:hypothetical protein